MSTLPDWECQDCGSLFDLDCEGRHFAEGDCGCCESSNIHLNPAKYPNKPMKQQYVKIPVHPGADYDANIKEMARAFAKATGDGTGDRWLTGIRAAVAAAWEAAQEG